MPIPFVAFTLFSKGFGNLCAGHEDGRANNALPAFTDGVPNALIQVRCTRGAHRVLMDATRTGGKQMSLARAKLLSVLPTILAAALSFNEPARAFIPEGSWVAYAICAGNLPGGKLRDGVPHSNEEVIEACTEVLNTQNRENYRWIALFRRGEAYQRLRKDLQAIENFNELLRLYPGDASGSVHALRAESYTRLGYIELAIAD